MSEQQSRKDKLTLEEVAKLEKIGERVTEYYSQDPEKIPPPDGNEHEDGRILKRILEEKDKTN